MLVGKRTHLVEFQLQVQGRNFQYIDVFETKLPAGFVLPEPTPLLKLIDVKVVDQDLAVQLQAAKEIHFGIQTDKSIVRAANQLFCPPEKEDWVEVL